MHRIDNKYMKKDYHMAQSIILVISRFGMLAIGVAVGQVPLWYLYNHHANIKGTIIGVIIGILLMAMPLLFLKIKRILYIIEYIENSLCLSSLIVIAVIIKVNIIKGIWNINTKETIVLLIATIYFVSVAIMARKIRKKSA